ncbi:MAG: LysE family transporter [Bacteroidia bacterium]
MVFFEGIIAGLPLALLIGPVLFTLLQASLRHGWQGGMAAAVGISISDVVAVALLMGLAHNWLLREDVQWWLGIVAACLLAGLGLRYLLKPPQSMEMAKLTRKGLLAWAIQGFLVNFVNPFVFAVWLSYIAFAGNAYGEGGVLPFLAGAITSVFITDALKAIFSDKLLRLLKPAWLRRFYLGIGIMLIAAAVVVLVKIL